MPCLVGMSYVTWNCTSPVCKKGNTTSRFCHLYFVINIQTLYNIQDQSTDSKDSFNPRFVSFQTVVYYPLSNVLKIYVKPELRSWKVNLNVIFLLKFVFSVLFMPYLGIVLVSLRMWLDLIITDIGGGGCKCTKFLPYS